MRNPLAPRRRRRRTASIATLVGGALAAVALKFFGFGHTPNSPPKNAQSAPPASTSSTAKSSSSTDTAAGGFDFYTLALSLAPAFCESAPHKKQCSALDLASFQKTPLTLHGLWPERLRAGSYPENCTEEKFRLRDIDSPRLRLYMPGLSDGLATHEWKKHGTCSTLDAKTYFASALDQLERINAALQPVLSAAAGKTIDAASIRADAQRLMPGLGAAITLHCKNLPNRPAPMRGVPVLLELRVCLSKDAQNRPSTLAECAALDRIDQGCGSRFGIDLP
jgi:ribonuclease T2